MPIEDYRDNSELDKTLNDLREVMASAKVNNEVNIIQPVSFAPVVASSDDLTISNYATYFDDTHGGGDDLVYHQGDSVSDFDGDAATKNNDITRADDNTEYSNKGTLEEQPADLVVRV